ncbi:MAG: FkbM family methyltransferase [Acidobacteria bacterium]|nr:FkbM family methyltransferase [Acidobacteriota bacterium]MBI3425579.1 FkbM family methyltransferase [Acidobacteriota bacterium]
MESKGRHTWPLYQRVLAVWREGGLVKVSSRLCDYQARASRLGIWGALAFLLKERFWQIIASLGYKPRAVYRLYTKLCDYPLFCRFDSSDREVFKHIFIHEEYSCISDQAQPRLIIDGGANVGYSSAYFLSRFPLAHVIAVEPDSGNFAILERNLAAYKDRVTLINAGIWSHETGLIVCRGSYKDGKEWSTQVRECRNGEAPDVRAVDIGVILENANWKGKPLDILKLDIERSEAIVFSSNYQGWIKNVKSFVIELHDETCERVFYSALEFGDFTFSTVGDMTVAKRIDFNEM